MSILPGCQEARRMVVILERTCPVCGGMTELFLRDGVPAAEPVCEHCGARLTAWESAEDP